MDDSGQAGDPVKDALVHQGYDQPANPSVSKRPFYIKMAVALCAVLVLGIFAYAYSSGGLSTLSFGDLKKSLSSDDGNSFASFSKSSTPKTALVNTFEDPLGLDDLVTDKNGENVFYSIANYTDTESIRWRHLYFNGERKDSHIGLAEIKISPDGEHYAYRVSGEDGHGKDVFLDGVKITTTNRPFAIAPWGFDEKTKFYYTRNEKSQTYEEYRNGESSPVELYLDGKKIATYSDILTGIIPGSDGLAYVANDSGSLYYIHGTTKEKLDLTVQDSTIKASTTTVDIRTAGYQEPVLFSGNTLAYVKKVTWRCIDSTWKTEKDCGREYIIVNGKEVGSPGGDQAPLSWNLYRDQILVSIYNGSYSVLERPDNPRYGWKTQYTYTYLIVDANTGTIVYNGTSLPASWEAYTDTDSIEYSKQEVFSSNKKHKLEAIFVGKYSQENVSDRKTADGLEGVEKRLGNFVLLDNTIVSYYPPGTGIIKNSLGFDADGSYYFYFIERKINDRNELWRVVGSLDGTASLLPPTNLPSTYSDPYGGLCSANGYRLFSVQKGNLTIDLEASYFDNKKPIRVVVGSQERPFSISSSGSEDRPYTLTISNIYESKTTFESFSLWLSYKDSSGSEKDSAVFACTTKVE